MMSCRCTRSRRFRENSEFEKSLEERTQTKKNNETTTTTMNFNAQQPSFNFHVHGHGAKSSFGNAGVPKPPTHESKSTGSTFSFNSPFSASKGEQPQTSNSWEKPSTASATAQKFENPFASGFNTNWNQAQTNFSTQTNPSNNFSSPNSSQQYFSKPESPAPNAPSFVSWAQPQFQGQNFTPQTAFKPEQPQLNSQVSNNLQPQVNAFFPPSPQPTQSSIVQPPSPSTVSPNSGPSVRDFPNPHKCPDWDTVMAETQNVQYGLGYETPKHPIMTQKKFYSNGPLSNGRRGYKKVDIPMPTYKPMLVGGGAARKLEF
jgi:hypothetical protein